MVSLRTVTTAGKFRESAKGTGPTDSELPCLQASVEQTSRPHSFGTINERQSHLIEPANFPPIVAESLSRILPGGVV